MPLTAAQRLVLKTDILANGDTLAKYTLGDLTGLADLYNALATPDLYVYRTSILPQEIFDGIVWANLTPTDPPDTTQIWANRALACQGKQLTLQLLLVGQSFINAARSNVRAGLQDTLTNVPSGVGGALVSAGWVPVRDTVLARKGTRVEKLFASGGNGTTPALAATLTIEGPIGYPDFQGL